MKGTVLKSTGSNYWVRLENGEIEVCALRGKLRLGDLNVTNPVAVGDKVVVVKQEEHNTPVISEVLERENYVIRKSPKHRYARHIVAANLDQAALVVTVASPRTSQGFIDRFILTAEAYHIPVILLFNKQDIIQKKKDLAKQTEMIELYQSLGYTCLKISALQDENVTEAGQLMLNKTTLLSGHSGSGKSTLVNAFLPELNLKTNEISSFSSKGMHTTSYAEMHRLEENSWLIDTPGIKELGILDIAPEEISHYFVEMRRELQDCKFHNCLHVNEPGCKILDLLETDKISSSRYASYLSMVEEAKNTVNY